MVILYVELCGHVCSFIQYIIQKTRQNICTDRIPAGSKMTIKLKWKISQLNNQSIGQTVFVQQSQYKHKNVTQRAYSINTIFPTTPHLTHNIRTPYTYTLFIKKQKTKHCHELKQDLRKRYLISNKFPIRKHQKRMKIVIIQRSKSKEKKLNCKIRQFKCNEDQIFKY